MPKPHYLAHALRATRIRQGRTQHDVGWLTYTTQATVARWENGDREPNLGTLGRWAYALDLDLALIPRDATGGLMPDFELLAHACQQIRNGHLGFDKEPEA